LVSRTPHVYVRPTLRRLRSISVLPTVAENESLAPNEIRCGDNDRLAALVAHLMRADALVLLSDVDALYDGNPAHPGTSVVHLVRDPADLRGIDIGSAGKRGVGTGGMMTKGDPARVAAEAGGLAVLTSAANARAALTGGRVGSFFAPAPGRRPSARQLWLAHATAGRGSLVLDPGAVRAVVEEKASLLPAGVVKVKGDFSAGDPVDLRDEDGTVIARGLVNYDATEVPGLLGRSTRWLAREMGPSYERELVHRDDLVVL